jgi:uncharacterized membrane protein
MYNRYSSPTVLGIDERFERPLTYVLGWITGIIFLVIEKRNANVRRHAYQSLVIFGGLSIISLALSLIGGLFGAINIPLISGIIGSFTGILGWLVGLVGVVAWVGLIILSFLSPETFIGNHRRDLV